jgi:hypothetical protein
MVSLRALIRRDVEQSLSNEECGQISASDVMAVQPLSPIDELSHWPFFVIPYVNETHSGEWFASGQSRKRKPAREIKGQMTPPDRIPSIHGARCPSQEHQLFRHLTLIS